MDIETAIEWVQTRKIRKFAHGVVAHGETIDLKTHSGGMNWSNAQIIINLKDIEIEGNTKRVFLDYSEVADGEFNFTICATTATNIANIYDEGVSTKYGNGIWFAFEG